MAPVPPLFCAELARLAHLPRRAGQVLLGSLRPLDCMLFAPGEAIQPWLAIWTDERTNALWGAQLINPHTSTTAGRGEALGALIHALTRAVLPPTSPRTSGRLTTSPRSHHASVGDLQWLRPGLPERICVDDCELAVLAEEAVRPLRIPVEFRSYLSGMDAFFSRLAGFLATIEPPSQSGSPPPNPVPRALAPAGEDTLRGEDDIQLDGTR